jgi:prephenate dehydrogenase
LEVGAIDESFDSPAAAVAGSDLIILCTPVSLFEPLLREIADVVEPGAIVTDVGSTKRSVVQLAESTLPNTSHFVGSHPIAGSEKRGVEYAKADLFQGAMCILTPSPKTNPLALEKVDQFWRRLGMRMQRMTPEEHDQRICEVSHLPHAVAAALIAMQADDAMPLAGKGFLDTTRIAGGDGALWRDILQDNRDNVARSIERLSVQLKHLIELLDPARAEELAKWLDQAAERRAKLLAEKLRELQ